MEIITSIIFIVLFIILLIFIFSLALITPMEEMKTVSSIVAMGFVIGIIGGAFLIAPVYEELPSVAGSIQNLFGESEKVYIEVSTKSNVNSLKKQIEGIDGVRSVENDGLYLETTSFSEERKKIIEEKIPLIDDNFKSWKVDSSGKIQINLTENYDPENAVKILSEWLVFTADIQTKFSIVKLKINVEPGKVDNVLNFLNSQGIVVSSVEGPVQEAVENTKVNMLDTNIIIFLMGLLGVLLALFGIYYDEIVRYLKELREKIKIKIEELKEDFEEKKEDLKEDIEFRKEKFNEKISFKKKK